MTDTATRPAPIHIQQRDIDGLVLCGEHGGAPYDLLAAALDVAPVRLRGITARWRRAGYAATGQVGPGPAWCWLTRSGMEDTGLDYRPGPPSLGRVQHARALLAVRLALRRPGLAAAPAVVAIGTPHPPQGPVRRPAPARRRSVVAGRGRRRTPGWSGRSRPN